MNKTTAILEPDIPSASELLLDILGMLECVSISAAQAEVAGEAFGYSAATMRATLSRLRKKGSLHSMGRGEYRLSETPSAQWQFNRNWQNHIAEPLEWQGEWILASWADNASLLRNQTLSREALLLRYGFQKWRPQLFIRPDNLVGSLPTVRLALNNWPDGVTIACSQMRDIETEQEEHLFSLWPESRLDYQALSSLLHNSRSSIGQSADASAATEVLSLGRLAVKSILRDARLPKPSGNLSALQAFGSELSDYEAFGIAVWKRFLSL